MKNIFCILLFFLSLFSTAQRSYVHGVVKDSTTYNPLTKVHIQNIDAGSLTSSNEYGKFRIPVKTGDTLIFSNVGYKTQAWVVDSDWIGQEEIEFLLSSSIIYLDEVIVGKIPAYEDFKEMIVQDQPQDTVFRIFGMSKMEMDPYPVLEKREYLNPIFIFFHPISAMYHSFSKKEKEKRKMQRIKQNESIREKARSKFSREWVSENTKLEEDKLTDFILYCNFSDEYLANSLQYTIYELMMNLLPKFLKEYEED